MLAGQGHRIRTWVVRNVAALPEAVDIEIPLRRTYEGEPAVLWDDIEVTKEKQSLGAAETETHRLRVHHIWWQPAGTTARSSDGKGSIFLREPGVAIEWSGEVIDERRGRDPVVNTRLELWTTDGKPLEFRGAAGRLHHYRSEQPQKVRFMWALTFARDTGKTFVFSGVRPESLAAPKTIVTPHGTVTVTGAVEGALDTALEAAIASIRAKRREHDKDVAAALKKLGAHVYWNDQGQVDKVDFQMGPAGDQALVHLKGLKNLKTLLLNETDVTDAGLRHLRDLTKLEALVLDGTRITDAGLAHLTELPIENLSVKNTGVTGAKAVIRALPDVRSVQLTGFTIER